MHRRLRRAGELGRSALPDIAFGAGAVLVSIGAGLIAIPAGLIIGGLFLVAAAVLHERGGAE